ncbi:two-component system sensor histidine kinase NtrB [Luteithermobacter gelatinilyticus]|uniref:two-component system sensor histidine kinase NtrB n=1 Tax=Luteithermobacter gelatinilyticus TaxID=2582913 RepID=UPI0011060355|nr:ATP-binding protein [Luteithermobacter gelatinilyticus]
MGKHATTEKSRRKGVNLDALLDSLPDSILVVDKNDKIIFVNSAAETLFYQGAKVLLRQRVTDLVPSDSPLASLIEQSRQTRQVISEYDVLLANPRNPEHKVDIHVSPMLDDENQILIQLQERSIAQKINQQLFHRGAARSVTGMAAVLAHEIKNPLSGIRGSAQLLEQDATEEEKTLTRLICEETDRICALVDQMEVFSDRKPIDPVEVNIHSVLEHVKKLAENGFGKHVRFHEYYDPSLPATVGDRAQLIQVFLNLVKNAAEAAPAIGGEVTLTTAYRHGVRVTAPGGRERLHLPLEICVIDNGPGVPEDLKLHLFDPFVTTKPCGTGLGLALVAKIVGDHGGIIECDSEPGKTLFRVLLPIAVH